ncbi:MAG: TRAP transporter small permease subunit [Rhizobiales bacterium]|nr:TRAP transporter small permease subunit [Hyphomicrobiales bacterium]
MNANTNEVSKNGGGSKSLFLTANYNIIKWIDLSGKIISVSCLASMFAAILVNVILRYFFNSGISWAYEIHSLLLPWLVAGGIVVASAHKQNITIHLLFDLLSENKRRFLEIVIALIIIIIAISVLWTSQPILRASKYQNLSTLGVKQIWGYASLIYAFACMAIISLLDFLRLSSSFFERRS